MSRDRDWRFRLRQLREKPAECEFPLRVFSFGSPSCESWPSSLPSNQLLLDFYSIVDGGWFGDDLWFDALNQLDMMDA